jgi:hypothetical protein
MPPQNVWELFELKKGARNLGEAYGPGWLANLDRASVMIPRNFAKLCCAYDVTVRDLVAHRKPAKPPTEWTRAIKSKLWKQRAGKGQFESAVAEHPMLLVKVLQGGLRLAAVVGKKRGPAAEEDVWRTLRIRPVWFSVTGPGDWLDEVRHANPGGIERLKERLVELRLLDWRVNFAKLVEAVGEGQCVTFVIARAFHETLGCNGVNLNIELGRRRQGNMKPACPLVKFMLGPSGAELEDISEATDRAERV